MYGTRVYVNFSTLLCVCVCVCVCVMCCMDRIDSVTTIVTDVAVGTYRAPDNGLVVGKVLCARLGVQDRRLEWSKIGTRKRTVVSGRHSKGRI